MSFAVRDGVRIYWRLDGDPTRPPLVLLNSIGTDMAAWDRTVPLLIGDFQLLRIDTRGHGASDAPDGDYAMTGLAADVATVMDAAGIARAAIAGVSLGGMIAMQLALDAPERVDALIAVCTSAAMDPAVWVERLANVRAGGTEAIADLAVGRFLSPAFAAAHPEIASGLRRGLSAMADAGYAGAGAAIRDMELAPRLGEIRAPTLVIAGDRDVSTPAADHSARIAREVPGAKLVSIPSAHLAPVEAPGPLAMAMRDFLLGASVEEEAEGRLYEAGLANRRRVLGDEWVDRSLAGRNDFNRDFQALITRIAWHEIWGRPGLDDRTRRLVAVAITAALGRSEEFRLHVRSGLERGGFTEDDLKEVLMQAAIYAGVPAANTAFAEAAEIIAARREGEPEV